MPPPLQFFKAALHLAKQPLLFGDSVGYFAKLRQKDTDSKARFGRQVAAWLRELTQFSFFSVDRTQAVHTYMGLEFERAQARNFTEPPAVQPNSPDGDGLAN